MLELIFIVLVIAAAIFGLFVQAFVLLSRKIGRAIEKIWEKLRDEKKGVS